MFDNTLPVSMSDNSQLSLDNSEMTTSVKVISYNFPDMIDESSGTFTDYTASNLDNGYHTTSSVVSCRSFITSSNYYNINNNLKVSEHAYLFSSGSNDYWSWRKPSDIQVGDYLLGINEEIRQVSSSEQIVNGTIGLSQINVEDVDTLFVNGYLVHNGLEDDPGGGSGASFSFVNQSASIHLNAKHSRSPFLNQLEQDSTSAYLLSDINAGNDCSSAFRLRGGLSTGGGTGTAQNIKLGMRTNATSDDFRFIQFTLASGTNGLGNLSGSGLTGRTIDIQLSGSFVDDDPSPAVSVPATTIHLITPGEYKGHMQLTASAGTGGTTVSTFGDLKVVDLLLAKRFDVTGTPNPFSFRDVDSTAFLNAFPTHSGEVRQAQISAKDIRDFATTNTNQSKPNFRATDSQTQESALAGSGFSPAGNREQETISMDEIHSSSYTANL